MPIYAYKCTTCGHAADVLQKMSDAPLTVCPSCGASTYAKQVTAAGFALKGSGWYVTDFRGGNTGGGKAADASEGASKPDAAKTTDSAKAAPSAETAKSSDSASSPSPATPPASATPAAAPATKAA